MIKHVNENDYIELFIIVVLVCVCVHENSKNNGPIHFKLEHIVVYENSLDKLGIVQAKSRSRRDFEIFLNFPQCKLSSPLSQPQHWNKLGSCD